MLTNCQQVASLIYSFNHRELERARECADALTSMPRFTGINTAL